MNVSIPPELEAFVTSKVASGEYTSPSQVVHEALRLFDERDAWLREQILPALEEMNEHPERAISAESALDTLRAHHASRVKRSA